MTGPSKDGAAGAGEEITVWRAPRGLRIFAIVAIVVFAVLIANVAIKWGFYATIGILLTLGVLAQVYWQLLRPKLIAGPDGVDVVSDRQPVHLAWTDIRRAEAGAKGITIICADGRAIQSRVPHAAKPTPAGRTIVSGQPAATTRAEIDLAADYLTRRAAWARKSTGPKPRYTAPVAAKAK